MNAATADQSDIEQFLETWFALCPAGQFVEVRPLNKRPGQRPMRQSFVTSAAAAADAIRESDANGDDVYIGALPRKLPNGQAKSVGAHVWLWADLDYGTVGHATPAPHATADDAFAAIVATGIAPTMVVDTGGGFHVWYALATEPAISDWRDGIRNLCHALSADANATDPARILRVPGTRNMKTEPPRPARIVSIDPSVAHSIDVFLALPSPTVNDPPAQPHAAAPASPTTHAGARPFDRANDIPIATVLEWLGVKMTRQGSRTYCACPAHNGKNATQMVVGGEENSAHCFGDCGRSFSPVDIVAAARRIEPREAVNRLAERFNFDGFGAKVYQHPKANAPRPQPTSSVAASSDWRAGLTQTAQGATKNTLGNLIMILRHHDKYAGQLTFDVMCLQQMFKGVPVGDTFVTRVREEVERDFGICPTAENTRAAIAAIAEEQSYHPIRRYLDGLAWDGIPRIDRVAPDVLGANGELATVMLRKWFISAVARAMKPGCKVDTALVLVGEQSLLKSTFFSVLGGGWFADTAMDITSTDGKLQLHSAWIYEWAEMESITSRKHASEVKAFVTSQSDTFRAPYGRSVVSHPRTTVIVGSTNETEFLSDPTGSRRFWVINVTRLVDVQRLGEWRDQLWAEAVALYRSNAPWWLTRGEDGERAEAAEIHQVEDSWATPVMQWLATSAEARSGRTTMHSVLTNALNIDAARRTRGIENRVGSIMRRVGWRSAVERVGGIPSRLWILEQQNWSPSGTQ